MTGHKLGRREWLLDSARVIGTAALAGPAMAADASESPEQIDRCVQKVGEVMPPMANNSVLDLIGNTSLLEIKRIVPEGHGRVFLKVESENPTGSMKDRMALAMIEAAEADGRLKPGGHVVEYTGGSTGTSLAFICRIKGYPIDLVSSDAFSLEKRNHMKALGANLTVIKSDFGGMDEKLTRTMIATARDIREEHGSFWTDQLNNADMINGYHVMGEEIWRQTGGRIDAFVQGVGTGGSLRGVAEQLRQHKPKVKIVAVEPAESSVLSGGEQGSHNIEGIGAGFIVPLWRPELVDSINQVTTVDAQAMARRLAAVEGVFAGTSTGANLITALKVAGELGPDSTVVTLMVDSGLKYLSTPLYNEQIQ